MPPTDPAAVRVFLLPCTKSFSWRWSSRWPSRHNQNFAVVRDTVPLDLKAGANDVRFTDTTTHLEPDSVILRDPAGKVRLRILEQNYRADPVSQALLLSLFEGKTIDFLVPHQGEKGRGRPRQDHPQRLRAARQRPATLQQPVLPAADGLRQQRGGHGRTHHRGGWQAAFFPARPADLSRAGRRHDPQADPRLENRQRREPPNSTPSWPTSPAA